MPATFSCSPLAGAAGVGVHPGDAGGGGGTAAAPTGAPHWGQKATPSATDEPHFPQNAMDGPQFPPFTDPWDAKSARRGPALDFGIPTTYANLVWIFKRKAPAHEIRN